MPGRDPKLWPVIWRVQSKSSSSCGKLPMSRLPGRLLSFAEMVSTTTTSNSPGVQIQLKGSELL